MHDSHKDHPSTIKDDIEDLKQGAKSGVAFAGGFAGDDEERAEKRERREEEREARDAEKHQTSPFERGSTMRSELDDDTILAPDETEQSGLNATGGLAGRSGF